MKGVKWIKRNIPVRKLNDRVITTAESYSAVLGNISLTCRPSIKYPNHYEHKAYCVGYQGSARYNGQSVFGTVRKSLHLAKKDAEKFATRYLLGGGNIVLKQLKRTGLLEEALFDVGIDI